MSHPTRNATRVLCLCLILSLAPQSGAADAEITKAPPVPAAVRMPWTRGNTRFQRQWLLLGPYYSPPGSAAPAIDPSILPHPGVSVPTPGQPPAAWIAHKAWSDMTDLAFIPNAGAVVAPDAPETETAFAYTEVTCAQEGPWELSLGIDGFVEAWVNGVRVRERSGPLVYTVDEIRIPVRLRAGRNDVLLRLTRHGSPWRMALRVVAPGTALDPAVENIQPLALDSPPGVLDVRTDAFPHPGAAQVRVEVQAAGGRTVASAEADRGAVVRFATGGWPDGAYELRCSTRTNWGRPSTTFVPWYKGDALAAARRLEAAAASAPPGPAGDHLRLLSDLVGKWTTISPPPPPRGIWLRLHPTLLEWEELQQSQSGGPGPFHGGGFVRLAYTDPVDGSTQFCRAYLPPDYDPARRWPVVISLHGYLPGDPPYILWWSVDQGHNEVAEAKNVVVLEPHGRGNTGYASIGEADVLRGLAEARKVISIDDDRVYLTGESMGGGGTWYLASRHPDLFAAAAPVYGGWDKRAARGFDGVMLPPTDDPFLAFIEERDSTFSNAESLLNLPLYVHHGDSDPMVNVDNTRHIVRQLQRWGYDVRYSEHVGFGHEDLAERLDDVDWMLRHRRDPAPRRVRIRSTDLASAAAYWLRIDRLIQPVSLIAADAEALEPGLIRVDTANAAEISLALPPSLRGHRPAAVVIWNGVPHVLSAAGGWVALAQPGYQPAGLHKTPQREGPLMGFIETPFAVVVGTASADPAMRRLCREKGEEYCRQWENWQRQRPRILDDRDVSAEDERTLSLLLIGGPDSNLISRRFAAQLPYATGAGRITVDGRTWVATDAVLQMIYPSPCARDRYFMVAAPTSVRGLSYWKPGVWGAAAGFGSNLWDWVIRDGRRRAMPAEAEGDPGWLAAGVFDASWRRDDRWTSGGGH